MAQYLILIYGDETSYAEAREGTFNKMMAEFTEFQEKNAAVLRGGEALQPTATATSIRTDATGGVTVTDGPFAEVKEALGGYYVIEAADLDEAIAVARQVPAPFGGVEVRPVMVFD
jgi:hypothetical protein